MPFLPFFILLSFATEDYVGKSFVVRERAPSRFVFRLFRSKDRLSLPFVSSGDHAQDHVRFHEIGRVQFWEGTRASLCCYSWNCCIGHVCVHIYIHIYINVLHRADHLPGSKDPCGHQTVPRECTGSKVDFLLSFDIYCSYTCSEIRSYPNVMVISHVTCLGWPNVLD